MGFLDTGILRWFLKPYFVAGRLTLKVATRTGAFALKLADNVLGLQFLQDLSEFFLAFEGMYAGFKERAGRVRALLRSAEAGFVVVASPAALTLDEAVYFHRRLEENEMPFVAFVVNRVHPDPAQGFPPTRSAADVDDELAEALVEVFQDQRRLARRIRRSVDRLEGLTGTGRDPRCRVRGRRAQPGRAEGDGGRHVRSGYGTAGGGTHAAAGGGERGATMRIILYSGKGGVGKTSLVRRYRGALGPARAGARWSSPPTPPTAWPTPCRCRWAARPRRCRRTSTR
jgi:hypothetical protein